jgi:uncharacterized membrane protein YeaQ/YmgE (transglycosylase-associated protein family)
MLLYWVIVVGIVSAFVAFVLEQLLESGGTLTRRGVIAEFIVGVLFTVAGACLPVMLFILITN